MSVRSLILMAGYAGSGKTTFARIAAKQLGIALLDKDPMTRLFANSLMERLNDDANDRESQIYLAEVRPLEYKSMLAVALENAQLEVPTILCAPFLRELKDVTWVKNLRAQLNEADFKLTIIWVSLPLDLMKENIISRGEKRDAGKLQNWSAYSSLISSEDAGYRDLADLVLVNDEQGEVKMLAALETLCSLLEQ